MYLTLVHGGLSASISTASDVFYCIPSRPNYEISADGVVRNARSGRVLMARPRQSAVRYYLVTSIGRVHRLLAEALAGRTLQPHELVLHKNGEAFDNRPENLRIGTAAENSRDKIASNTNGRRLRNQDIRDLRALAPHRSRRELAAQFRISTSHVGAILTGRRWRNLP
jgi:hypothetical protein